MCWQNNFPKEFMITKYSFLLKFSKTENSIHMELKLQAVRALLLI